MPRLKKLILPPEPGQLRIVENPDNTELPVVAGPGIDPPLPHAPHSLGQELAVGARDIFYRDVEQKVVFASECGDDAGVQGAHTLRPRPAARYLGKELGKGNDVAEVFRGARLSRLCPVRQREHPIEHADGDGGSADRTNTAGLERLIRLHADPALAVAVQVVLPLFRVELERPQETLAGPQGTHQA